MNYKSLYYAITDTWALTRRNLIRYVRLPQLLFFSAIQPIIFLSLFNFVFGGALGSNAHVPGGHYINFLLPGVLVQTALFGALNTGVGLAEDMGKGIIDRFRSLPMNRAAVMAGRTLSDTIRNLAVVGIMLTMGSIYGFRFQAGLVNALATIGIVILFGFAVSWVYAFIGLSVKDTETAQLAGFAFVFPLTFASTAFVPLQTMPKWLQVFSRNQPITHAVQAARELALGIPSGGAVWRTLIWCVGMLAVFVPLAVWRYRSRT